MTDLQYFRDLHADAKSFDMKAFYESFIRQLNGGVLKKQFSIIKGNDDTV
jgi:hypothetical protein